MPKQFVTNTGVRLTAPAGFMKAALVSIAALVAADPAMMVEGPGMTAAQVIKPFVKTY